MRAPAESEYATSFSMAVKPAAARYSPALPAPAEAKTRGLAPERVKTCTTPPIASAP
ncbi:MAG: hypothetical protein IPJ28_04660 [Betaproteobacteria bacterium]|nr:hypothetical protein [Betaproteobacteria bacterium]